MRRKGERVHKKEGKSKAGPQTLTREANDKAHAPTAKTLDDVRSLPAVDRSSLSKGSKRDRFDLTHTCTQPTKQPPIYLQLEGAAAMLLPPMVQPTVQELSVNTMQIGIVRHMDQSQAELHERNNVNFKGM